MRMVTEKMQYVAFAEIDGELRIVCLGEPGQNKIAVFKDAISKLFEYQRNYVERVSIEELESIIDSSEVLTLREASLKHARQMMKHYAPENSAI